MAARPNHVQTFWTWGKVEKRLRFTGRRRVIIGRVEDDDRDRIEFGDKLTCVKYFLAWSAVSNVNECVGRFPGKFVINRKTNRDDSVHAFSNNRISGDENAVTGP